MRSVVELDWVIIFSKGRRLNDFTYVEEKKSDSCEIWTHAGEPTALAGQRLNHSAKESATISLPVLPPYNTQSGFHYPLSVVDLTKYQYH